MIRAWDHKHQNAFLEIIGPAAAARAAPQSPTDLEYGSDRDSTPSSSQVGETVPSQIIPQDLITHKAHSINVHKLQPSTYTAGIMTDHTAGLPSTGTSPSWRQEEGPHSQNLQSDLLSHVTRINSKQTKLDNNPAGNITTDNADTARPRCQSDEKLQIQQWGLSERDVQSDHAFGPQQISFICAPGPETGSSHIHISESAVSIANLRKCIKLILLADQRIHDSTSPKSVGDTATSH